MTAIIVLLALIFIALAIIAGLAISFTLRLRGVNVWRLEQVFVDLRRKDENRMNTQAWRSR